MKMTTHTQLAMKLNVYGAIPSLPIYFQHKHRNNPISIMLLIKTFSFHSFKHKYNVNNEKEKN
jgi:hypothetical protein